MKHWELWSSWEYTREDHSRVNLFVGFYNFLTHISLYQQRQFVELLYISKCIQFQSVLFFHSKLQTILPVTITIDTARSYLYSDDYQLLKYKLNTKIRGVYINISQECCCHKHKIKMNFLFWLYAACLWSFYR